MQFLRNVNAKIFFTVLLVYLFYIAPGYLSANTNRFIVLTKSIVDDKTFTIDEYYSYTRDYGVYNGHYYIGAAPGLSFMAVPLYASLKPLISLIPPDLYKNMEFNILHLFFSFFLSVLPGAMLAVLLYDILGKFNLKEKEKKLIVFTSSFGTILFFYSTRFMAHTAGAFFLFSAFYIFFKFKDKTMPAVLPFLAGVCLGMAGLVEYSLIAGSFFVAIYGFYVMRKDKLLKYIPFILGIVIMTFLFMYYHQKCFGAPFRIATSYSRMIGPIPITFPKPKILFELTLGAYRGMFIFMPIMFVSLYGLFVFFKNPEKTYVVEMILVTAIFVSIFFIVVLFSNKVWPWGGSFGPRFFTCFVPFLMISIVFAYKRIKFRTIFWISAISILINWCGVQYGDSDNAFINVGLFLFRGLNSNLAEWTYGITNTYVRKLNVITHFSPFAGFVVLIAVIYLIWKEELDKAAKIYFCGLNKAR